MPETPARPEKMNLRLSTHEKNLRDGLAEHYGIDAAGVMRMGLLELARNAGVTEETIAAKKKNAAKR